VESSRGVSITLGVVVVAVALFGGGMAQCRGVEKDPDDVLPVLLLVEGKQLRANS
jgi:hypothetical protein